MANLLSSLLSSTSALRAYDRVLEVTQNNVANASTPGYVKQTLALDALSFAPEFGGEGGGVRAGDLNSARDRYAEQAVRKQVTDKGQSDQQVDRLTALQSVFNISAGKGIPAALSRLYQSFSAWSANPSDAVSRQSVLDRAGDVAHEFQQTVQSIDSLTRETAQQIRQTVDSINSIAKKLAGYNQQIRGGAQHDPSLDASVHNALEELAQFAGFSTIQQSDGTYEVLLNSAIPVVVGDQGYPLTVDTPEQARILAADGTDITAEIPSGRLGALLDTHNRLLPGLIGDSNQPGELNRLAQAVADRVNQTLTAGNISDGPPVQPGVPLFTYSGGADIARTLAVDPSITPADLAAIDAGPPYVSNGIPLKLAALAAPENSADRIDNLSYTEFYGVLAGRVGQALNDAQTDQEVHQSLVAQARELRKQSSGISLDEEATILIQFQRAYQANAQLIKTLDELTGYIIDVLR
jgi:flagellar hook-associated protein 1 FlgK